MNTEVISKVEKKFAVKRPEIAIGDTVIVSTVIRDGEKKRIQKFKGIIIAMKGKGLTRTFTVRKISYGVGVERIFLLSSPNVAEIEIVKHAKVRRSKLYYLRDRIGKAATTLRHGRKVEEAENVVENEEEVEEAVEAEEVASEEVAAEEETSAPEVESSEPAKEEEPKAETKEEEAASK